MLNQVVLVGRLTDIKELNTDGKKRVRIVIAANRSYKNEEGIYETDFIPCLLTNTIAQTTIEYCKKGDIIGIKGRLEKESGKALEIIAEKVTFLSSSKREE